MEEDLAAARTLITELDLFPGQAPETIAMVRLGGMTNRVYRLGEGPSAVVVRFPGKGTEEYIDRRIEFVAAQAAAVSGVSPQVIHAIPATGVLISLFIDGAVTMTPALFASRPGAPERAGRAFRQLHDSKAIFDFRFELFAMIDAYLALLATKNVVFPGVTRTVCAKPRRSERRSPRIRSRWRRATAIRLPKTSSIRAKRCGSSTGNTPG